MLFTIRQTIPPGQLSIATQFHLVAFAQSPECDSFREIRGTKKRSIRERVRLYN